MGKAGAGDGAVRKEPHTRRREALSKTHCLARILGTPLL